ncbi:hypothetical protein [Streptomyces sp. NPDC001100]
MTDTAVELETVEPVGSAPSGQPASVSDEQLVAMPVERARPEGLPLSGLPSRDSPVTERDVTLLMAGRMVRSRLGTSASMPGRAWGRVMDAAADHASGRQETGYGAGRRVEE